MQWIDVRGAALTLVLAALMLGAGCGKTPPGILPAGSTAAPATVEANNRVAKSLPQGDLKSAEDVKRGFIARPHGKIMADDGTVAWDYDLFTFIDGDAPASANPSLWRHAKLNNESGLFKVRDGIYQLRGFDLANITLIEGKSGWIVVDALTSRETARAAMEFVGKYLGERPVSVIIFTHSHVDHFGGALGIVSGDEAMRRKLPIVAPVGFMDEATSENILLGNAMTRRATWQFGTNLAISPQGRIDTGLGKGVATGTIGILPPTITVDRTPQELTLDGVRFVFQNVPGSEAPAELAFYLPDYKTYCGAEILTQTMHNLYTLRGAKVRDSLLWAGYIDDAITRFGGTAEVFFAQHHWPIWGNAAITDYLKKSRDTYRYIHDQTVRMINAGMKPNEIAEQIRLPKSLESSLPVRGYYGTLKHNSRAVYQHYMGFFDGNPANLDPLPRVDAARRYVELMGGANKVVVAAQAAFDKGEFRWAAEVLNHVVFAQSDHMAAKELLARTYDQLGYQAESAIWRNFYLTGALELRTGKTGEGVDRSRFIEMLAWTPIERFLDAMAAGLNGPNAEGKELTINLVFSDLKESHVLWIENSVMHHRRGTPDRDADATLTLTKPVFLKMMTGTASIKDLVMSDEFKVRGSKIDLVRFFTSIDRPPSGFPIVTP